MSDNTNLEGGSPEDNEVIRGLREQLKVANKAVKTAGDDAVAKVKRVATASSLMPEGFEGLSDVYEKEVDGELTTESAAEWLKGRGFSAPSDAASEEAAKVANELEAVTNLGGAVQAAGSLTPEDSTIQQLKELKESGDYRTLPDLTAAIDNLLNG